MDGLRHICFDHAPETLSTTSRTMLLMEKLDPKYVLTRDVACLLKACEDNLVAEKNAMVNIRSQGYLFFITSFGT